jgi:NAD(P)-dependent dehydrogenase (short-subunit alcohol dehydrogenase family)
MAGLVCLVTGATSGIGRATALEFARRGATVAMVARSEERGAAALEAITGATGNTNVRLFVADLSLQADVQALCGDFTRRFDRLDVLVNDAAVFVQKRTVTREGLELMFATNQVAPFLLTLLLLPTLKAASPSRVINVTAPSTVRPDFEDLQGEHRFRATRAFGASKAANLLFTFAAARRLAGSGVTVNAYHPGLVRTDLMRNAALPMRALTGVLNRLRGKTADEAAGEIAELAASPFFQNTSGKLIHDGKPMRSPFEDDVETQERLFLACEELTATYLPG